MKNLNQLMRTRGLTNAELSRHTGINRVTIGGWRNGDDKCSTIQKAIMVADFLGVSVDELVRPPSRGKKL